MICAQPFDAQTKWLHDALEKRERQTLAAVDDQPARRMTSWRMRWKAHSISSCGARGYVQSDTFAKSPVRKRTQMFMAAGAMLHQAVPGRAVLTWRRMSGSHPVRSLCQTDDAGGVVLIEQDHLQAYELTLTTQGLLYVGSGKKLPRKEYIFNARKQTVAFLNEQAFFDLLIQNGLVELFEGYCMRQGGDLYTFLYRECGLNAAQVEAGGSLRGGRFERHGRGTHAQGYRLLHARCETSGPMYRAAASKAQFERRCFSMRFKKSRPHHDFIDDKRGIPEAAYFHTLNLNSKEKGRRGQQPHARHSDFGQPAD